MAVRGMSCSTDATQRQSQQEGEGYGLAPVRLCQDISIARSARMRRRGADAAE